MTHPQLSFETLKIKTIFPDWNGTPAFGDDRFIKVCGDRTCSFHFRGEKTLRYVKGELNNPKVRFNLHVRNTYLYDGDDELILQTSFFDAFLYVLATIKYILNSICTHSIFQVRQLEHFCLIEVEGIGRTEISDIVTYTAV